MTIEKFDAEIQVLKKFFETYCQYKNNFCQTYKLTTTFKENDFNYDFFVCKESYDLILYAIERLKECPHEIKPKCRSCPNPCYEKSKYKAVAKIMRYSGMRLGLLKIKKLFTSTQN